MRACEDCGLPTGKRPNAKLCAACVRVRDRAHRMKRVKGARPCIGCGGPTGMTLGQARRCAPCARLKKNTVSRARQKRKYEANRDAMLQIASKYRATHREAVTARTREWRATPSARLRKHIYDNVRRAKLLSKSVGPFTPADWALICDMHGNRCAYCLRPGLKLTMDHVEPIARGGEHSTENIVPACQPCNSRKHARTLLDFVRRGGLSP